MNEQLIHRNSEIYEKYKKRYQPDRKPVTLEEIGKQYNPPITKQRVWQIIKREVKREEL